ncbi:acyl-CoA synthetase [Halorussus marinus]|uniref:acyl-CoA synthetase n=1 Tax=Halorussus marinus TaxID=2505976 RepID=UPI00143CCC97|nr:AMP-binding protein [Halorussus marinus]
MDILTPFASYNRNWEHFDDLCETFTWRLPSRFNIGHRICERQSDSPDRPAIRTVGPTQPTKTYTYGQLAEESNRFANYLAEVGVESGDRVAIQTTQRPEVVVAHLATWKLGAISVILNPLLGQEETTSQLTQTGATAGVFDSAVLEPSSIPEQYGDSLSALVFLDDSAPTVGQSYERAIKHQTAEPRATDTAPDDDAFIVYTSGTTGDPKGVVHTHSTLIGHLPTFCLTFANLSLEASQRFWTVSNWASIALMSNVMAPLFAGRTVLAHARTSRFDPEEALKIVADQQVTNLSASPTALRLMQQVPNIRSRSNLSELNIITTGGEEVSDSLVDWWAELDVIVHEVYGQTEANNIVADCNELLDIQSNAIGCPMPGHDVAILDPENPTSEVGCDKVGEIGVRIDDPICFDRYWESPEQTTKSVQEGWLLTGDLGVQNRDGAIFFRSRKDDVIISSGRRIGPAEIETALATHPAVINAGVVGVDDELRGEIPIAFVAIRDEVQPSERLVMELQEHVKERMAKYKHPRDIVFLDSVPTTNTGTIARGELREIAAQQRDT